MTGQETFNMVCEHLMSQNEPSLLHQNAASEICAYRSPDGKKCAVGCLIPDDRYDKKMERQAADDDVVASVLLDLGHDIPLCVDLQEIHDSSDPHYWPLELAALAEGEQLEIPRCVADRLDLP